LKEATPFRFVFAGALPLALALSMSPQVIAQTADAYPSKPVTLVVPVAAGGPTDVEARLYSKKLVQDTGISAE